MELEIVFGVENLVAESAVVGEAAGEMNALNVLSVGQQKIYVSLPETFLQRWSLSFKKETERFF